MRDHIIQILELSDRDLNCDNHVNHDKYQKEKKMKNRLNSELFNRELEITKVSRYP